MIIDFYTLQLTSHNFIISAILLNCGWRSGNRNCLHIPLRLYVFLIPIYGALDFPSATTSLAEPIVCHLVIFCAHSPQTFITTFI